MTKHKVNNFCDGSPIDIDGSSSRDFGALVSIRQDQGAMHFQHSMRSDQAREMAEKLLLAADEAEAAQTIELLTVPA